MVKINQITDNNNKKLLFKIIGVLFAAVICTIFLSVLQKPNLRHLNNPTINLPIVYEYAPIKITTVDNQEIWLELYIEPYSNVDLPKIHKSEQKIRQIIKQKISAFPISVLAFPENRPQIETILKKQIDLALYPATVKNIHFDLVRA